MQKILVIQTAFIGDVILGSAVLEALHKELPDAQLDLLVRKGNESLFKDHPYLGDLLIWNKRESKYKGLFRMLRTIRKNRYDVVINLHRFASSGFLTAFSGAPKRIGYEKNPWSFRFTEKHEHPIGEKGDSEFLHEVERNHSLLNSLVSGEATRPKLYPSAYDHAVIEPFIKKKFITIAAGSVWFTKQWPIHKWRELLDRYSRHRVLFLGGPSERFLVREIQNDFNTLDIVNMCGELSLLQSAAVMKSAEMNFVNDSAPMHLCSAVNAPVTAIYCSTIPEFGFGPLSDRSYVVQTKLDLDCRPCGLHGKKACPEGHFKCAHSVRADQFIQLDS